MACHGSRHRAVLQLVCPVPNHERFNAEACRASALPTNTRPALAVGQARLHGSIAQVERLRLFTSRNRQIYITGTFTTYDYTRDGESSRVVILYGDHKTPRNAGIDRIRPRPKVHFQILEGTAPTHGDETPHVDFIPSTNGWSDGTGQSFHRPSVAGTSPQQPERLGRALPNG